MLLHNLIIKIRLSLLLTSTIRMFAHAPMMLTILLSFLAITILTSKLFLATAQKLQAMLFKALLELYLLS
jgi:hypothetical protein